MLGVQERWRRLSSAGYTRSSILSNCNTYKGMVAFSRKVETDLWGSLASRPSLTGWVARSNEKHRLKGKKYGLMASDKHPMLTSGFYMHAYTHVNMYTHELIHVTECVCHSHRQTHRHWRCNLVVWYVPGMNAALGLIPNIKKEKKRKEKERKVVFNGLVN